jgi:hypothetical protein
VDNCFLSARSSCRARVFPSFTPEGEPNLAPSVREQLAAVGCGDVSVVEVQHYLLCVLSAGGYRAAWESELHHDYPRVPAPPDAETFQQLAELGAQLAAVHAGACETPWISREPQPGARFGDLELDPVDGGLRLSGTLLITLSAEALAVRIGHHAPLAAYIHQRAGLRLDAEGLGAVYTRAERLNQLARLHHEADVAVAARLAAYCGG